MTESQVKPLDLSTLLRHAFLSGRGLGKLDKLSDADQTAWMEYDPEPLRAYQRIRSALLPTTRDSLLDEMAKALEATETLLHMCSVSEGVCCCGDNMERHADPMSCGHSPVDHGAYVADGLLTQITALLTRYKNEVSGTSPERSRHE